MVLFVGRVGQGGFEVFLRRLGVELINLRSEPIGLPKLHGFTVEAESTETKMKAMMRVIHVYTKTFSTYA